MWAQARDGFGSGAAHCEEKSEGGESQLVLFARQEAPGMLVRTGSSDGGRRREMDLPRRSRRSAPAWPCTGGTVNRARIVARRSSASCTRIMRPTTVRRARQGASCSRTERCHACFGKTGRRRSTKWNSAAHVERRRCDDASHILLGRVIHDASLRSTRCSLKCNGWTAEPFMNNPG